MGLFVDFWDRPEFYRATKFLYQILQTEWSFAIFLKKVGKLNDGSGNHHGVLGQTLRWMTHAGF